MFESGAWRLGFIVRVLKRNCVGRELNQVDCLEGNHADHYTTDAMPRQLYTALFLVLVALLLSSTPEVSAKSSCSYACMKTLFSCKRRSEGDCCNKFTECFHTCDLAAPPCAGKRGSWNKRYQVSQGYEDRELYPYY
uniref:Uncharacterized protein n=1 Tax=Magallana gigas TaxID=29159 RepID=K1QS26_MAGGI